MTRSVEDSAGLDALRRAMLLRDLIGLTGDTYFVVDSGGRMEGLAASDSEAVRGGPGAPGDVRRVLPPSQAALFEGAIAQVIETGEMCVRDYALPVGAGPEYEEATFYPFGDERVAVVIRDATLRRRRDGELRASQQRYQALVEVSPYGIVVSGQDDRILFANRPAARILGFGEPDDLAGVDVQRFVAADQLDDLAADGRRALRDRQNGPPGAEPPAAATPMRRSMTTGDGRSAEIELSAVRTDFDGSPATMLVFRDVTVQAAAERRASEFERRLELVVDFSPFGMQFWNVEIGGRIELTEENPAADAILGTERSALLGCDMQEVFGAGGADLAGSCLEIACSGGVQRWESVEYSRHGASRVLEVTAFGLEPGRIATVFQDVTSRRRHEETELAYLRRLQRLAQELVRTEDQERRRLAIDLHDRVSQHLAVARIRVAESLRADDPGLREAAVESALELLKQAIEEARAITRDLSPYALYELGLAAALRALAESVQSLYGLTCTVEVPERVYAPDVDVAAFLCRSARELLANVAKHSGADRALVGLDESDGVLRLVVEDHGSGVGDAGWERDVGAFGLLSIRERARALGGSMSVGSAEDGTGTRVVVTVPLMAPW